MSTAEGDLPGEIPLTRTDIPNLVQAVVAALDSSAFHETPPGKSLNDGSAKKKLQTKQITKLKLSRKIKKKRFKLINEDNFYMGMQNGKPRRMIRLDF